MTFKEFWGLLNSPIAQLFKKLPTYDDYVEFDEHPDGYWEERDDAIEFIPYEKSLRQQSEEKAFFRTPLDFIPQGNNMPVAVMDDLKTTANAFTIGNSRASDVQTNWYVNHGFIGYQTCAIIAQHWLVNRACSIPGKDAIRNGFVINTNSGTTLEPEVIQDIKDLDEQFELNRHMLEFSRFNRIFGIRIMLYVVKSKDKKYYEKPFNIDGVTEGSYQGMVQVDPYWITPELDGDAAGNPASPDFYEPTYWRISGKLYHKSHLVITRYAEVADVLKPNYIYGGIPLTQMLYERVYAAERSANEVPELLLTKRLYTLKADTKKIFAQFGKFLQRVSQLVGLKNNQGFHIIDKDEEVDKHETTLTDVNEVMEGQYSLVSSISEVPETKLLSKQIKGMGNKGDAETRNYGQVLEDEQVRLDPLVNRHHLLLVKSHIEPKRGEQPRVCHTWNLVETPTPKEASEIRKNDAETDKIYSVDIQAVDAEEVREKLATDKESGYSLDIPESGEDADYSEYDEDTEAGQTFPNSIPVIAGSPTN